MMLGEMGAEVIKIETPHGRDTAADIHHGTPVHCEPSCPRLLGTRR